MAKCNELTPLPFEGLWSLLSLCYCAEADRWAGSIVCGFHASQHGPNSSETHRRALHSHHAWGTYCCTSFFLIGCLLTLASYMTYLGLDLLSQTLAFFSSEFFTFVGF